jgi:hypothetical protein
VRTMNGKEVQLSSSDNGTNKKQAMYNWMLAQEPRKIKL